MLDMEPLLLYNQMVNLKTKGQQKVGAVIAAAGSSQRMGGLEKMPAQIGGRPVLARVIDVFHRCQTIGQIVVVVAEKNIEWCHQMATEENWSKVTDICPGGERRRDSVAAGLSRLKDCHWAVIHDGARPLLTEDLIQQGLTEAKKTGAAVAAIPVADTIKLAGDDRLVRQTLPRPNLWAVQTPQVFRFDIINEAHHQIKGDVTDDASLVEQLGYKVKLYMGSYDNIKITTPEDMAIAEVLIKKYGK